MAGVVHLGRRSRRLRRSRVRRAGRLVRGSSAADLVRGSGRLGGPGIAVAQAIGRLGNWFNQELYGRPTTLPWGLEIDPAHRAPGFEQYATFHPTFLYESVWNLVVAGVLLLADQRFRLGRGKVFALYLALYGFGRVFTEHLRLDPSYDVFGPIRFNEAGAMLICVAGIVAFGWLRKYRPGRESVVEFGEPSAGNQREPR